MLAAGFNTIAGALRGLVGNVAGVFGPGFAGFIEKAMDKLNIGLQDAIAKAEILKAGEVLKSFLVITIPFGSS